QYYFVHRNGQFLIQQRKDDFIWKKLFEFPPTISDDLKPFIKSVKTINHKLTHKNLSIEIFNVEIDSETVWKNFIAENHYIITDVDGSHERSFPKPLENYIQNYNVAYRIL
ncbi:NUDIX domain-containing protein, partial [Chryseobacterium sp. 2TAF14]|uniref:NUDIX domain-containing protein n=1 Tax=Chryseobacterium sp. 2TAF14 TaxID=3233007 RepID=UPI003F8E8F5C